MGSLSGFSRCCCAGGEGAGELGEAPAADLGLPFVAPFADRRHDGSRLRVPHVCQVDLSEFSGKAEALENPW